MIKRKGNSMANILFVSETKSFIVSSLVNQLEKQNHQIMRVYNLAQYEKNNEEIHFLLIYAEEALSVRKKMLMSLRDKALERNIPILVLGDLENIEDVIPMRFVWKHLPHPINVKTVVEVVEGGLNQKENTEKKQILVVDDSGAMLRNIKGWLEDKYQVALANSGAMAIKYLALNRPDLILLDYEMPICDGKQVLEMIRSERDSASIPVIFLTCKNDKESVMNVSGLKPEGYLLKTMEPSRIVRTIDHFFESRK